MGAQRTLQMCDSINRTNHLDLQHEIFPDNNLLVTGVSLCLYIVRGQ